MEQERMLKLLSGSDVRGTALSVDGAPVDLTDETVFDIVNAFIYWMSARLKRDKLKIAIGHDCRLSSGRILESALKALKSSGCTAMVCGLCSTPSMYMMTKHAQTQADGAIMITASHHSYEKNGLKFFTAEGGLEKSEVEDILKFAATKERIVRRGATVLQENYLQLYADFLVNKVRETTGERRPFEKLKIIVDAGNGAGGFFADKVLKVLGADTKGSIFLEPDGNFPNHAPNPEDRHAMSFISEAVVKNKADFGIIFDTDVDRAACVDSDGTEINRNRLIALVSAIMLSEEPGATIVTDSVTSDNLTKFISSRHGKHYRYKRGYKNVIDEAISLNQNGISTPLAIETSGHAAFRENYFLDDGAYLVIRILITLCGLKKQGKPLMSLIEGYRESLEEGEFRLKFSPEAFSPRAAKQVLEHIRKASRGKWGWKLRESYEGVRVSTKGGWFLVRISVHDPILPINIENDRKGGVERTKNALYRILKKYKNIINLEPLSKRGANSEK